MTALRRIRSRFGSHATTVKVKRESPWYWQSTLYLIFVAVCLTGGVWMYQHGRAEGEQRAAAVMRSVDDVRAEYKLTAEKLARLELENENLRISLAKANNEVQMSQSSQTDLTHALQNLQEDNTRLSGELAFLRRMTDKENSQNGLKLSNFTVEREGSRNTYRYRALLVLGGKPDREFQGRAELQVSVESNGQTKVLSGADSGQEKSLVQVAKFKYYQRLEGSFRVADGVVVKSVQLAIYEKGNAAPRLTKSINL